MKTVDKPIVRTPTKVELRKVTYYEQGSEETSCYHAQVWADGKHVADVSNSGHGGCDLQHPAKGKTHADVDALNKRIAAEFPRNAYQGQDLGPADLESACGDLLTEWLLARDLKRLLGRCVAFTTPELPGLRTVSFKQKGHKFGTDEVLAHVRAKYPKASILNTLPIASALAIYTQAGSR